MGALLQELERQIGQYLPRLVTAALVLLLFWLVNSFVGRLLARMRGSVAEHRKDVFVLLEQTIWIAIWVVGAITALGTLHVDVSALVAGLGLTGFALGFALKDAIANLLAGAMILFYRPFRRGDAVAVSGVEGTVTEINLRYTIIAGNEKSFLVPNSLLLSNTITLRQPSPAASRSTPS